MIFSVVIPVCNGEDFIEECVCSAVDQSRGLEGIEDDFEIIVCENGSVDRTPEICDELSSKYSNVTIIHRGRIGLFRARQEGIKVAKGEWIVSLDGDDRLAPGALKNLYDAIEACKKAADEADIILYDAAVLGHPENKLRNYTFAPNKVYKGNDKQPFMEQLCRDDSLNAMWIKCVRRSIAAFDDMDLFLNYGEDLYQTAQFFDRAEGILYLDKILYYYRRDSVSLSSSYSEIYLEDEKNTWKQLDEYSAKWFGDRFVNTISERKALTCTIAVSKLIYSDLSNKDKKYKFDKLLSDPFYREFSLKTLPEWAPEEAVYVNRLQHDRKCRNKLLFEGLKRNLKNKIKGKLINAGRAKKQF